MTSSLPQLELAPNACLFRREDAWCLATSTQMHALRADPNEVLELVRAIRAGTLTRETPLAAPLERAGLLRERRRLHGTVLVSNAELRQLIEPLLTDNSENRVQVVGDADPATEGITLAVIDDGGRGPAGIAEHLPSADVGGPTWLPWFLDGTEHIVGPLIGPDATGLQWRDVVLRRRSAAPSPQALDELWVAQAEGTLLTGAATPVATRSISAGLAVRQIIAFLAGRSEPGLQHVVYADGSGWSDHHVLPVPACA